MKIIELHACNRSADPRGNCFACVTDEVGNTEQQGGFVWIVLALHLKMPV